MDDIIKDAERKMGYTVDHTREEFAAIRTGRAHPAMFSKIMVDYYGSPTPLQQLATFQVPEARTVLISPFDRGSMKAIEKAIRDSDLGVNPADDGNVIRLVMPQLTEERRREYIKVARHKAEDGRIAVRNGRRHALDAIKKLEKDKEIGEDDAKGADKKLDVITKKYIDQIDAELKAKEAELLEV
ncbi:ribosome recycling factor [Propioniciclava tarda]|uniref:ribosome recycling factor n=1 Tax=Propioniciclava tarda TaxID=433330 RepID=UPI0015D5D6EB|nr:ribosome recycling factor [Propioniciclava tarda]HOA87974.1 ribosome recycling factor [Propioniciclava tarda]HQA29908.1 ribosome recycling factor [Propioniciclava tarda]HQD60742.1 ribosome recycling factor [Propioniciclava tarda]